MKAAVVLELHDIPQTFSKTTGRDITDKNNPIKEAKWLSGLLKCPHAVV